MHAGVNSAGDNGGGVQRNEGFTLSAKVGQEDKSQTDSVRAVGGRKAVLPGVAGDQGEALDGGTVRSGHTEGVFEGRAEKDAEREDEDELEGEVRQAKPAELGEEEQKTGVGAEEGGEVENCVQDGMSRAGLETS